MNTPATDTGGGLVRLRLDIAYDGTDFAGWATQAGQRTVAGVLDDALSTVFRVPVAARAAGRTDTGVHATGQVAHVDVPADAVPHAYPRTRRAGRGRVPPVGAPAGPVAARGRPGRSRSSARQPVSTPGSRRCAGTTSYRLSTAPYGVEPQAGAVRDGVAASAGRRRDERGGRANCVGLHDFAAFCRHRDGRHHDPRSAAAGLASATATGSRPMSAPTRSAGRWCARWSARCWRWGSTAATRRGARAADRDTALQRFRRRTGARPDTGRRRLPARRPAGGTHRGHARSAHR